MVRRMLRLSFIAVLLATGCNSLFGIQEGTPRPMCVDDLTIDDMEDADGWICRRFAGRTGVWFDFGDGSPTGELTPSSNKAFTPTRIEDGSRGTSRYAARFSGSGFTIFGAIMGLDLLSPRQPFDLGGLGGVTFWMRSNGPVAIDFPTEETVPVSEGGQCESACNRHFSFQITAPAPGWVEYDVPFNALRVGAGSAPWNPRHLYGINFRVSAGAPFDVWIDDLAFYACGGPECAPTCTDPRFPVSCSAMGGPRSSCQPPDTNCADLDSRCADPLVIDDMEDGDSAICASGGRQGFWYSAGDGTSTDLTPGQDADFLQTEIPGGRGTSHYAARLTGSGFTDFGALMGFAPNDGKPYDASGASGLTFWMKSNVAASVSFPTLETNSPSDGGECAEGEYLCNNRFAFQITAPPNEWTEYHVPFAALAQNAGSATWQPSHLLHIDFAARRDTPFDVWVDDVAFYGCAGSSCVPTCTDPAFPVQCPASALAPAGCRRPGTDCATFVRGCGASNTTVAPPDGLIATFMGAGGGSGNDIAGDIFALGTPAPTTTTTNGALHIAMNAPSASMAQELFVVDHFKDCVDGTGVHRRAVFDQRCHLGLHARLLHRGQRAPL